MSGQERQHDAASDPCKRRVRWAQAGVAALFFANGTTIGSWVPHIPDRARDLGLNSAQLGATLLAFGVGAVIAMPLAGGLIARWGSRRATCLVAPLFPAFLAMAVLAPTAQLLAAALGLAGMSGATMDVGMNAHGVLVEKELGRRTVSLFHGLFSVGCVAGSAATNTALAHQLSSSSVVITIAVLLALIVGWAWGVLLEDAPDAPYGAQLEAQGASAGAAVPLPARFQALLPHGRLLLLGVLTFSAMVSEGGVADWSALLLRVTRGLGNGVVGYGFTCFSSTMVLGRFTGDRVVALLGEVGALRLGGLLGVLGFGLMLASRSLPLILSGFALAGLGLANSSPILYRAAGRLPGFAPGAAIAVAVGVGYAGLLAGPPALGFLAHVAGLRSIFYVLLGLCGVIGLAAPLVRSAALAVGSLPSSDPVSAEPVL